LVNGYILSRERAAALRRRGYRNAALRNAALALLALVLGSCAARTPIERVDELATWPDPIVELKYESPADGSAQSAAFYRPRAESPAPLLVALHSWSYDWRQTSSIPYAEWCIANGWVFIHPDFRGPNRRPEATGSELVIADILGAVKAARENASVDGSRIYLIGVSGGGYAALLLAGRAPEIWAGVSAWVPITDLALWHEHCAARGLRYAGEIAASCGGPPLPGTAAHDEAKRRSALTWLGNARGFAIDIHAGIRDGHEGSVPISHSLEAFNLLARPEDRLDAEEVAEFTARPSVPPRLAARSVAPSVDPAYGDKPPLFRAESGDVRVTIFDGGHEILHRVALEWLARQKRTARSTRTRE
jgi:dienelactone hydrolase